MPRGANVKRTWGTWRKCGAGLITHVVGPCPSLKLIEVKAPHKNSWYHNMSVSPPEYFQPDPFTMASSQDYCAVCIENKPANRMVRCPGCNNLTCLLCANRWAYDRYLINGEPDCCFCRHNTNVVDLHAIHLGEFLPAVPCEDEVMYSELAHIEEGLDLPYLTWEDYFQLFGWNTARQAAANPDPEVGLFAPMTPIMDYLDLTASDIEFVDLTQDTDDTDWTPRRDPSPSHTNRRVRRRLLDSRRELRVRTR